MFLNPYSCFNSSIRSSNSRLCSAMAFTNWVQAVETGPTRQLVGAEQRDAQAFYVFGLRRLDHRLAGVEQIAAVVVGMDGLASLFR